MNIKQTLPIALSLCLFIGCKKTEDKADFKGTYKGKFIEVVDKTVISVDSEVNFTGQNYVATNGTGTFKIEDTSKVKFSMANIESMDYVANEVLHGEYSYVIKGDSLILNKIMLYPETANTIPYANQYRLKRVK